MSSPIIFLNSQPDEGIQEAELSVPFKPASYMTPYEKLSPERPKQPGSSLKRSPWSSAKKRGVKTTPKARLRHDDSQIQFAAIDSSPLQPNEVESQMLTDRQKEVRQRQILEASTMFSNLGQVPQSTDQVPNGTVPRLQLAENELSSSPILTGDEVISSPVQIDLADVVGSSPTPRSRIERFRCRPVAQEPSLSPVVQVSSSVDIPMPSGSDAPSEPQAETAEKEDDADLSDRDMPMSNNDSFPSLSEHVGETLDSFGARMDQPRTPTRKFVLKEPIGKTVDSSPLSRNVVFFGTRPESLQSSDDKAHNQVSDIESASVAPPPALRPFNEAITGGTHQEIAIPMMHSETREVSQDREVFATASHDPNEEEQIAAQLVNDLERASSQVESERGNPTWTASPRVNAKRKRAPEDSESDGKTKKPRAQASRKRQNIQIVVDSRRAGGAGAENVDISADGLSPASSQHAGLRNIGLPAKAAKGGKGRPKRTAPVPHGPGRGARSSSASACTECDSCGTSDATKLPASNVKRTRADHVPVGARRRSARLRGLPGSSPALPHSDAARTSSDAFGEFSGADDLEGISVPVEQAPADDHSTAQQQTGDAGQELHEMNSPHGNVGAEVDAGGQEIPVGVNGSGDVAEEGKAVRAQGILQGLRKLLENIKRVTLGVEEEREIVSVLVDSVREVHEAGRRHGKMAPSEKHGNEAS